MKKGRNNDKLKRVHTFCIKLNPKELEVFNKYCKKYNITNKSQFIRQTLMKAIFEKMVEQDYPSLFDFSGQETNTFLTGKEDGQTTTTDTNITDNDIDHPKLF